MIATHYQIDFSEHYLADYLATRGIGFLGWNTRFRGFESSFLLDHALVDIGVGVRWLRDVQGVETVVLLGNSGGGSLMAAYQSQAVDPNVTPLHGMRPAAGLTELLARRRLRGHRRAPRPPGGADRLDGRLRRRRKRSRRHRSRPRSVQRGPTVRRTRRSSSAATGPHRSRATTPSPTGSRRSSNVFGPPGFRIGRSP